MESTKAIQNKPLCCSGGKWQNAYQQYKPLSGEPGPGPWTPEALLLAKQLMSDCEERLQEQWRWLNTETSSAAGSIFVF